MLCLTGNERTVADLSRRMERAASSLRAPDVLHEVRLDALAEWDEGVFDLLRRHAGEVLVCCRPHRQGGAYSGDESHRLELLERVASSGVAYLDVEDDISDEGLAKLRGAGARKLLLSWHGFTVDDVREVAGRLRRMTEERGADFVKVAVRVDDTAQLSELIAAGRRCAKQGISAVLIGMGPAGVLSRVRYAAFGSPWTYIAVDPRTATAPGQLSLRDVELLGLPELASAPFIALIGGPQALASPGPTVYNRLFRERGSALSYTLAITERLEETLSVLRQLGALGASVTMPHKREASVFSRADDLARRLGAANTLRFGADEIEATNTDAQGVAGPLDAALAELGVHVDDHCAALILGAGGAASAALEACRSLDLEVTVCARDIERARAQLGATVELIHWSRRGDRQPAILINATPIVGVDRSPWPSGVRLDAKVVFDLALSAAPSRLLETAREGGAHILTARDMWVHQGAAQMRWITSGELSPSPPELMELMP